MSPFQIRAVVVCLVINMLDGFDILVIAFVAPDIAELWKLSPQQVGILFSAGLLGMTAGSLLLAPLADIYGRRPAILVSLVITSAGMFVSALTESLGQLVAARALTGLGIGTMIASLTTIVAEYSSDKRRAAAISFSMAGYPIGAIFGGGLTIYLLQLDFGWDSVFMIGGVLTALMIPLAYWCLPESIEFMLTQRTDNTLARINTLMVKMGKIPLSTLDTEQEEHTPPTQRLAQLLGPSFRKKTLLIWMAFFLTMATLYFAQTWTPKLLVDAGYSASSGLSVGVLIQVGALLGLLAIGAITVRYSVYTTVAALMAIGCIAIVAFSALLANVGALLLLAGAIGFGVNAAVIGMYAIVADIYPAAIRTTAIGWAIGIGRMSAVIAPVLAGFGLGLGIEPKYLFAAFALPMALAAMIIPLVRANSNEGLEKDTRGR